MKRQILGIGFAIVFALFLFPRTVSALGISPPKISIDNVANNIELKKTFTISRGNPSKREFFKVSTQGTGAKYLHFNDILELPKGQVGVGFDFTLKAVGAPNGDYSALVIFNKTTPPAGMEDPVEQTVAGNGMTLSAGVIGSVHFTVTDKEIKDFVITNAYLEDTEVGQFAPLYFTLKNLGNIEARPEKVEYSISKILQNQELEHVVDNSLTKEAFEAVIPGETKAVSVFMKDNLLEGRYSTNLKIFDEGKEIFSANNVIFTVHPQGFLKQKVEIGAITLSKNDFEPGELVKFEGKLNNAGDIALDAVMSMEILKDNKSLDIISSPKKVLLRQQGGDFELTYKPTEKGKYQAQVYFSYGVNMTKTAEQAFEFTVSTPSNFLYIVLGIGVLLTLLIVVVVARKFVHKNIPTSMPIASVSTQVPPIQVPPVLPVVPVSEIPKTPDLGGINKPE